MANTRAIIDVQINTGQAASALRGLQTQLNSFQSALNTNNRVQASAAKNLASELSEMVNAGGFFTAETVRMQTAASRLDKTLQKGQGTIGDFWNARFRRDSTQAAAVLSLANARASALETQFVATGGAANGFRDSIAIRPLQAFNSQAAVSAQKLAIHRAMLTQSTTSMINFGKNTQWAGRQLMVGFTVPLTIFAATAGKAFREIEKESVNFRKVYGDAFTPPEEMEANLAAVKGLAKEYTKYGIAVKDTIGLAAQAAAAGSQGEELISATTEATRLATLGQMDQNQALETTIALQTAFGLQAQDLTKTINFLNMVENQTVVTLQDLAQAIPRVAPVIKGLGGSVEDMAAMLAAMQEGGVSAAQGANALKSGLASLINPTNRAIEKLEEMGVNLNYIVQTNRGDLMGTVQAFAQALSTLDEFQQQQALEKVFGKFQYARLGALFSNIIKDGSQASRVMDTAALSASQLASSADKELGAIEESAATKFTAAMERIKLSVAPIGEMFTEMAIPVLGFLGQLIEKFNELPDFAKKFIGFGTVITGIIIPAGTMFLGLLMNLVGTLIKFGNVIGVAFKGFATGGIKGAIQAVTQTLGYMSLAEIDAATAATQLGESTEFVNMALRDQPLAAGAASTAVDELAASYQILASRMMDASRASVAGGAFAVPGAAMARGRGGASNLVGRPLPIVARNSGGTIPGVGNRDTVPAVLTPGEFVVNKRATQENLSLLHAINNGKPVSMLNGGGAAGMTAAMQRVLGRVQTQRQEAASIPIAMGGRGGIRKTQAADAALSRGSQNIYNALTGNYGKGKNVRVDTLRFAVERLGLSPEQLGLKTRGNLTFRMSGDSNLAMMRGDLTRDRLIKELNAPDVYSPLSKQLDSYLGAKLDRNLFDTIYREEIAKLPATGITNGRFEKASRNAVRRYLDSAGFPKTRRNSFIKDILQGDVVNANASLPAIKQALDARGIKYTPGANKKDLYVDIDGRQVNIGNLAGREIGNLGRPEGVLDYAGLRGSGQAVHANLGGLISAVRARRAASKVMESQVVSLKGKRVAAHASSGVRLSDSAALDFLGPAERKFYESGMANPNTASRMRAEGKDLRLLDIDWSYNHLLRSGGGGLKNSSSVKGFADHIRSSSIDELFNRENPLSRVSPKIREEIKRSLAMEIEKTRTTPFGDNEFARSYEKAISSVRSKLKRSGSTESVAELENAVQRSKALREARLNISRPEGVLPVRTGKEDAIRNLSTEDRARLMNGEPFWYSRKRTERSSSKATALIFDGKDFVSVTTGSMRKINARQRALAAEQYPDMFMNKGGKVPMLRKGGLFLGMPHKFNKQDSELRSTLAASTAQAKQGRFASMPVSDVGSMVQGIGGRSSTIPGINGVYEVGGQKSVIKVHETADSALAEARSSSLMRDMFGLTSPKQELIKMKHPQTGDLIFAVRSPYDPRIANSNGKLKKGSFAQQLIASAMRRDSDLQPDNVFGSVVADSGASIFGMNDIGRPRAGQPRIIGDSPIPITEQLDINLLKTKGGAKKFFAEASADIARTMSPEQYEGLIKKAVADARARTEPAVSSLPNLTEAERDRYLRTILKDLDDLDLVDWKAMHSHHVGIFPQQKRPPTAAAAKKAQEAATKKEADQALRIRQKGSNAPRPFGLNFLNAGGTVFDSAQKRRTVPGTGNTDTVPAVLTPGEFVINKKAARNNMDILHAINSGQMIAPGYESGMSVVDAGYIEQAPSGKWLHKNSDGSVRASYASAAAAYRGMNLHRKNLQEQERKNQRSSKAVRKTRQPKAQVSQEKQASRTQTRMGVGMGMGAAGGAMMMAQMVPGIGENATLSGIASGGGLALSLASMLPMLGAGGPLTLGIAAAGVGLVGLGLVIKNNMEAQDEAAKKAAELGANLGGTSNALKKMSDVLGMATPAEARSQVQLGLDDKALRDAAAQFGEIVQGEGFQAMISDLKEATSEERMTKLTDYLRNAVAAGMMKEEDARKFAKVIGLMLQDPAVGAGVATAIKGQLSGPQGMLDLALGRENALEDSSAMQRMRSGEGFVESAGQEASTIIGSSFQIIQDAANAEALARQQFAEGLISYETYSDVIAEAEGLQVKYNDAIGEALSKTNDFGSTMQAVKDQLIKGGFVTDEFWSGIDAAMAASSEQSLGQAAIASGGAVQFDVLNEFGLASLYSDIPNLRENYGEDELTPKFQEMYGVRTVNELLDTLVTGIKDPVTNSLATLKEDILTAVIANPTGAVNYTDIAKRITGSEGAELDEALRETYSGFANAPGVSPTEAFDATTIVDQINRGLVSGVGSRDENMGVQSADQLSAQTNERERKITVDVFTNFISQGGDPVTFQTFLLSIPDEKKMSVVTAFNDMDQADREAWINDFGTIQSMLGPDSEGLTTEITLSAEYQDAGAGERQNIINGIKEFDQLPAFVDKKAIYSLETDDGKNPLTREEAERRMKTWKGVFKDLGSKNKATRQRAELQLATKYNGSPVSAKQMNAITKEYKNWDKLDIQSREEIISMTFSIQSQFETGGEFSELGIDTSGGLRDMKKQIQARVDTLKAEITAMQELEGTDEFDVSGLETAQNKLASYERAMGAVMDGISRANNIASGGPSGKKSGSGGSGGGAKSLAEQLAEDLKMATDILKNLRNVIDTNGFKAFIAGPFAPEFIDYLRQQGEEGLKVLKGGLNKIKTEYEKFRKLRIAEIITEATIAPMLRDQSIVQAFTSSAFRNQLMSSGLRGGEAESVMDQVPQEQLDALVALRQERAQILKGGVTGKEKQRLEDINAGIKTITSNIKNAVKAAKELRILSELDGAVSSITQAGEANSDFAQMLASGIDPTTATMYQELGLSFDAVNVKGKKATKALTQLAEAARSMKVAESIRSTIDALNGMSQDLKLTQTLASQGFTGEFAEELKTLGINAFSSAEQIAAAANGLKAMKLMQTLARTETEKLNIALENQNRALQAQIEAYQRNSIKPLEDQLQAINDIISAKQRDIEMEERKKEPYEKDIEALEEQKDSLREVYDQRIEALEKVSQINEKIAQQEKNQLDVASALSRGDIAGAAQAALQAQQQAAQSRIDEARDAIGGQYEDDQLSIEDQIKGKRDEIKKIDEEIDRIQGDIRKKQDESYDKQIEINNAKKEEAKMQEKMYKLQLLQSMAQTQADIRKAAQAGDTQAVGFLQQQLGSQLAIAGTDQASQEAFFNPVEGGRGVVQASYNDLMGKTPGDLVSQAMVDILPTIDGFRNVIMQGFSLQDATNPQSSMPAALRQLVQSAYNTAEEFKNPTTGLPYTTGEIVNVLGQNGALGILQPFVQNEFDGSIKNMGTMLQGVSEKMVGIGSIVDDIVDGFRSIRARINERIESAQAAIASLHSKITEANNTKIQVVTEVRYVNPQKKMFGGNVNYRGSTEKAPGFMYGGKMKGYAYGSVVPGTGMTDKVPALLTPGEFVIRKSVAQEYGPLLTAINSNVFPKMNTSGAMPKNSSNSKDGVQYNYEVNVNVAGSNASPDEIANTVMYKIKRMDDRQIRGTSIG